MDNDGFCCLLLLIICLLVVDSCFTLRPWLACAAEEFWQRLHSICRLWNPKPSSQTSCCRHGSWTGGSHYSPNSSTNGSLTRPNVTGGVYQEVSNFDCHCPDHCGAGAGVDMLFGWWEGFSHKCDQNEACRHQFKWRSPYLLVRWRCMGVRQC